MLYTPLILLLTLRSNMITTAEFKRDFQAGMPVHMAIIGDSTTVGFGANAGTNKWINGIAYGCVNNPTFSPNWDSLSPLALNTTNLISQEQQDNKAIPSGTRLLRTYIEAINPLSKVYNFGVAGHTAGSHITDNTMDAIATLAIKPTVVFIALGINSAKNGLSQDADIRTLINQAIYYGIRPILVKENNIAVAFTGNGVWSDTATPDQWVAKDNWPTYRANIDAIANEYYLDVIDLGSNDCKIDVTMLYDGFHPNEKGYYYIFKKYKEYLSNNAINFNSVSESFGGYITNGSLRIKTSSGIVSSYLIESIHGTINIKTSSGIFSI